MSSFRVLHIDDEADIREVVAISLGLHPEYDVSGCASGQDGLAAAAECRPDLILLDVMMPVMDGPTTLGHLRENPLTADIPVVFMTARAQTRELEHFKSLGAVGVIAKPFDPMTLAGSVRQYVLPAEDRLAAVRVVFLRRVQNDADVLIEVWSGLSSPAALTRIKDIAHGLAGAGGIFGFPEISRSAATLEEAVIIQLNGADTLRDVERALERLLTCLEMSRSNRSERAQRRLDA